MNPIYIKGMWGLGDNIFQRPFVRELAKRAPVFLDTPWPQLYADINDIHFIRSYRNLRTQNKNIAANPNIKWEPIPQYLSANIRNQYNLNSGSIITDMAQSFGMINFKPTLDLPPIQPPWPETSKPIALIRPVTVRTEWLNEARNPLPEYVNQIAAWLMDTHFVILVADIAAGETIVGSIPPHHGAYLHGELPLERLLALASSADVIVGGVGWIVPAAVAAGRRALIVLGGQGGHNRPDKILAPYWQTKLYFATPDQFCQCSNMRHKCSKTISNLQNHFQNFMEKT